MTATPRPLLCRQASTKTASHMAMTVCNASQTLHRVDFTASAVDSIASHKSKHGVGTPLFMYLSLHNTHMPCEAPPEFSLLYNYSDQSHNNRRNIFDGMVSTVDSTVANVTRALKTSDMWTNSLFVWACDNGADQRGGAGSK